MCVYLPVQPDPCGAEISAPRKIKSPLRAIRCIRGGSADLAVRQSFWISIYVRVEIRVGARACVCCQFEPSICQITIGDIDNPDVTPVWYQDGVAFSFIYIYIHTHTHTYTLCIDETYSVNHSILHCCNLSACELLSAFIVSFDDSHYTRNIFRGIDAIIAKKISI